MPHADRAGVPAARVRGPGYGQRGRLVDGVGDLFLGGLDAFPVGGKFLVRVGDAERFADTGGWAYTTFIGNSRTKRLSQDVLTACFACHTGAKGSNYVFSKYRL